MPRAKVCDELEAFIQFDTESCDYGVDHSPEWDEIRRDTLELESLHMFGRAWSEKELRVTFGDLGADALISLICDGIEEWEEC
jgi:hypothetical protein